jgi:hypothetical protein
MELKTKKNINEITQRSKDEFIWGTIGSKIKVALNKEYKKCKEDCIGIFPERKDYCVEKCRHLYYNRLEKAKQNMK